jgi:hypothetical protein
LVPRDLVGQDGPATVPVPSYPAPAGIESSEPSPQDSARADTTVSS